MLSSSYLVGFDETKIVVIGATGTLGKAIVSELSARHEVISAGFSQGDIQVDITNDASVQNMYKNIGPIDAVILATGKVHFASLEDMKIEDYDIGLQSKLMGQIKVVLTGLNYPVSATSSSFDKHLVAF